LENEANIPVHENIASTAEGILEDIMTGRVQVQKRVVHVGQWLCK